MHLWHPTYLEVTDTSTKNNESIPKPETMTYPLAICNGPIIKKISNDLPPFIREE